MKNPFYHYISLIIAVSLLTISCIKTTVMYEPKDSIRPSRTFIEYRVIRDSIRQRYDIYYRDENGELSKLDTIRSMKYKLLIGPVTKGFKAEIIDNFDCGLEIAIKNTYVPTPVVVKGKHKVEYIIK